MPGQSSALRLALVVGTVLFGAVLSIILRLAPTDQLLAWFKAQGWYTHIWFVVGGVVLCAIGIAVWQYVLAHPSKAAEMRLEVGVIDPGRYVNPPAGTGSVNETSVLYLLDVPKTAVTIVHCMVRLANSGKVAINDVRLQMEYPEEYLVDEVVVVGENMAVFAGGPIAAKRAGQREVNILEGVARVSYNLSVLRHGETIVIPEPLKIRYCQGTGAGSPALTTRLMRKPRFLDYLRLRVFVFSQEPRREAAFDIYTFSGSNMKDLDVAVDAINEAVWNGEVPRPGLYFRPFGLPRLGTARVEFWAPRLKTHIPQQLYQEIPLQANLAGILRLLLPPVDFRNTDARADLGSLVIQYRKTRHPDITLLTLKSPST